jgi:creatinine amidohydrolase
MSGPRSIPQPIQIPQVRICLADDSSFWPWLKWPDFAKLSDRAKTLVVVPIAGMADAALGHPLDSEETVLMTVLKAAAKARPGGLQLLVLPPLRFVLGPRDSCAFPVCPPLAHAIIREVVDSVKASGFHRVILLNASPWNEDLVDAAARDLRISLGIQMFCINLSALGLDFHPVRSASRRKLQTLLTGLYGREPVSAGAPEAGAGRSGSHLQPTLKPWDSLAAASAEAPAMVNACAERLLMLFQEIHDHRELSTPASQ